jgi:hypothetical protein
MAILVERLRQMVQTNIEGEAGEELTTYRVRVSAARSLYAWVTVEAANAEEARHVIGKRLSGTQARKATRTMSVSSASKK